MQRQGEQCTGLIQMTAGALRGDALALMLFAVQKYNLETSITYVIRW